MQLVFTLEERKLVTRALEKCLAQARADDFTAKRQIVYRLLDRILEHDLRLSVDELEDLSDILSSCKLEIRTRIAEAADPRAKSELQDQQNILEHAADKVTEACMMA